MENSDTTSGLEDKIKQNEENLNSQQPMEMQSETETALVPEIIKNTDESQNEENVNSQQTAEVQSEKETALDSEIIENKDENQSTVGIVNCNEVGVAHTLHDVVPEEEPAIDLNSESLKNSDMQIIQDTSPIAVSTDFQDKNSESLKNSDVQIIQDTSPIAVSTDFQDKGTELLKDNEIEITDNIIIDEVAQNNNSESLKNSDVQIIQDTSPIAVTTDFQDKGTELLKDNEAEITDNIVTDEVAQNNNSESLKNIDVRIIQGASTSPIAINTDFQDKGSELLKEKEIEITDNIAIDEVAKKNDYPLLKYLLQDKEIEIIKDTPHSIAIDNTTKPCQDIVNDSEPLKNKDIEIIEEPRSSVIVENISIDISSESSNDDEFENIIASVVKEAFVDNDSVKGNEGDKKTDDPLKNSSIDTPKDYESESSNDDEFEKLIETAVQEAFQDNDVSSPKEKDIDVQNKDDENAAATTNTDVSQDQVTDQFNRNIVEMSIDIPQNEQVNEISRYDMVRPFTRKKVEVELPEPSESALPKSESLAPPPEENWGGDHGFSFTVSYYDSKDKRNCAVYMESISRLYISKDFEFQVLCSAAGVPQGSVLRACVRYAAANVASKPVRRCKLHRQEDYSKGKQNVDHVIQSTHDGAKYEKDKDSERFSVVIPYQCSQGPFQGCAELSCYTYKFGCWSSCSNKIKQIFKVHFTLENNGVQLGRQVLEVKVCKYPEKDVNDDVENPTPISAKGMLQSYFIPVLNSKRYGDLLYWGEEYGVFYVKWTHKAKTEWSLDESAVFKDWDLIKGRKEAITDAEVVNCKQRVRAALRNIKSVKELKCEREGYKKYKVTNTRYLQPLKRGARESGKRTRNAKRPLSHGERRTSRKVEPIAYEEAADDIVADDEEEYGDPATPPPAKKMRLLPSPNARKRKKAAFSSRKKKRPPPRQIGGAERSAVAKKKRVGGGRFDFEGGFKEENFSPKVELKKLTLQDLLKAGVKMDTTEHYPGKSKGHKNKKSRSVPSSKSIPRRPSKKNTDCPVSATNLEPTREFPPIERNVFADQRINFEATPYQVHAPSGQSPSPLGMLPINWKDDKPNQMLNTYSNIKTQGDMIVAMIKAVLPSLPSDKVSQIYDYLADMGVENAGDLAFIEEDDLNRILKPIQSRKLIAAWKNKGIPSHSTSLQRRTCGSEPVTFVPAVFQIQNMTSQNQISDKVFSPPSDTPNKSTVMQSINIPGWRQSVPPPSVQDVYPNLSCTNTDAKPSKETPLPLPPPPKDWTDSFVIPWEELPVTIKNCLRKKQRPSKAFRFAIVHAVCDKIFRVIKCPMQSELETVARKMCDRFPESLCDEGQTGNKCKLLAQQMRNRMTTLRRGKSQGVALLEDEKRDLWLSEDYGKTLGEDSNSSSLASTTPSVVSYTSAAASSNPSTSTQSTDATTSADGIFTIPWHKLDSDILGVLQKKKKLSVLQRQIMARIVCSELVHWHPNLPKKSEKTRQIAEEMRQTFPASLSNASLGEAGGNESSSYLAELLRKRIWNAERDRKKKAGSSMGSQVKKRPPEKDSSGILDWAINFRIPWEKLPTHLLECLKKRERLTPTLRQEMVRVISGDIQAVEENPNKESVDFIAKKVCKTYPKSLCDMSGDKVGSNHEFLGRELLWRIQRVNYASKSLVPQETQNSVGNVNAFAKSNVMDEFVDVNMMDISSMNVSTAMEDRGAPMYYNSVDIGRNFGMDTVTYSRNRNATADYGGASTSTFYDSGNSFTPLNYITQLEQLIKKEVSEQDTMFSARMVEEFEQKTFG